MNSMTQSVEVETVDAEAMTRKPSFVDLRAFGDVALTRFRLLSPAAQDEQAFLTSRTPLISSGKPSPVAALILAPGCGRVESMPADEYLLVIKGSLSLHVGPQDHVLRDGDSIILPMGNSFAWTADEETVAITMRYAESKATGAAIVPTRKDPPFEPSAKPAADILIGPAPDCRNFNDYRVDDGKFVCGTWDSTPYHRHGFLYGHYEIMAILDGEVIFSDPDGRSQTFAKGDVLVVEHGAHCAWESRVDVVKAFAIYRMG